MNILNKIIIPIVFASDKNGAAFIYTAIISILENKKADSFCDFYVLISNNFKDNDKNTILDISKKYSNTKITFIDMNDKFENIKQNISHITSPTYYRLEIAKLLPTQYKKAIYLDFDTIVKKDLFEMLSIDIGDNYIAGVVAAGYLKHQKAIDYLNDIGISDPSNYINAGVTLWNLEKIRNTPTMDETLQTLAKKEFKSNDQDVINLAFYGKIKIIPFKYNYMTKYFKELKQNDSKLIEIYGKENILEAQNNSTIIHYADRKKPWAHLKSPLLKQWWYYAMKTPYKYKLIHNFIISNIKKIARKLHIYGNNK